MRFCCISIWKFSTMRESLLTCIHFNKKRLLELNTVGSTCCDTEVVILSDCSDTALQWDE